MVWILSPPGVSMRLGEEAPRLAQRRRGARRSSPSVGQLGAQRRRRPASPRRPGAEQAVLHLGRGGLGVGQAEDASAASTPPSSSRATRSVSTRVLPDPALAESQVERARVGGRR